MAQLELLEILKGLELEEQEILLETLELYVLQAELDNLLGILEQEFEVILLIELAHLQRGLQEVAAQEVVVALHQDEEDNINQKYI